MCNGMGSEFVSNLVSILASMPILNEGPFFCPSHRAMFKLGAKNFYFRCVSFDGSFLIGAHFCERAGCIGVYKSAPQSKKTGR